MSTKPPVVKYARGGGRQRKGGLDLNVPPPNENQEQAGGPTVSVSQTSITTAPTIPGSALPAPIDVEELDDDVVISSPRAFEEVNLLFYLLFYSYKTEFIYSQNSTLSSG